MNQQSNPTPDHVVEIHGITKSFGSHQALKGIDLQIPRGQVLGLLGPNGSGKTTTVRVLTTLLLPDAGTVTVNGYDVVRQAAKARSSIGLSGQYAAVDEKLTGYENLYMVGRLYGIRRKDAKARANELLNWFRLADVANKPCGKYSGGMRRRLDLAGALVAAPPVVVLDEPTTGLDPQGRIDTWGIVSELVNDGTTVLLTTQYLEEADQLADMIAVIDSGQVITRGTPDALKAQMGNGGIEVIAEHENDLGEIATILKAVGTGDVEIARATRRISVSAPDGQRALHHVLGEFTAAEIPVLEASLCRPTLDDVFLSLTGHRAKAESEPQ